MPPACSRTCASTSPAPRLIVTVVENPVINRVAFEGNSKLKDDQLTNEVQSKTRGTLSRPTVQADVQRIVEVYRRNGRFDVRVDPKIIELPNNRVDLVFEVKEGEKTGVKKINLRRQQSLWRPAAQGRDQDVGNDVGSVALIPPVGGHLRSRPHRSRPRPDPPLLSQARLCGRARGFGGVGLRSGEEGLHRHLHHRRGRRATSSARSMFSRTSRWWIRKRSTAVLKAGAGDVYNAEAVEKSVENLSIEVARRGYPFAVVRPRGDRDLATHTISVRFHRRRRPARLHRADQCPRQHPHPRLCDPPRIRRRRGRRIQPRAHRPRRTAPEEPQLFQDASRSPTSRARRPDRIVLNVDVEEIPTGEFSVAGGYSTASGWMAELSVAERNLLGQGQYGQVSRAIRPIRARLRAVVRRAVFPGSTARGRHRSLLPSKRWRRITFRTTARPSAWERAPDLR